MTSLCWSEAFFIVQNDPASTRWTDARPRWCNHSGSYTSEVCWHYSLLLIWPLNPDVSRWGFHMLVRGELEAPGSFVLSVSERCSSLGHLSVTGAHRVSYSLSDTKRLHTDLKTHRWSCVDQITARDFSNRRRTIYVLYITAAAASFFSQISPYHLYEAKKRRK